MRGKYYVRRSRCTAITIHKRNKRVHVTVFAVTLNIIIVRRRRCRFAELLAVDGHTTRAPHTFGTRRANRARFIGNYYWHSPTTAGRKQKGIRKVRGCKKKKKGNEKTQVSEAGISIEK